MSLYIKNYNKTVDYLYNLQKYGIKLGLKNPGRLMSILGNPQKSFRSIHIAGTNGKGSTASILASILTANGFKTGLFTSPHLVSFKERIRINNVPITESDVIKLTSYIRKSVTGTALKLTFFEFITAMAFFYFASNKIDWAVVEVGMGGRLDATNVILPDVCIITNIGIDHNEFLGKTISDIASEKAGIIKTKVPLVTAVTHPDALNVLKKTANDNDSDMHIYGRDFKSSLTFMDSDHMVFDYLSINTQNPDTNSCGKLKDLSLPATGQHQLSNVSLAIRASEILADREIPVSPDSLRKGISNLKFNGRFEPVSQKPPIIIDSAHNPEAAKALRDTVKEVFPLKKIILITGIMRDKNIRDILRPLIKISDTVILTKPKSERSASPEELKENIAILMKSGINGPGPDKILIADTVSASIELAKTLWKEDCIILITGSFYTTGEAMEFLGHSAVSPPQAAPMATMDRLSKLRE